MRGVTPVSLLLVGASGVLSGAVNAAAGGGTLIAFPALLATGMSARTANIVSTIGLVPGYAGGSVAYRDELAGQGRRLRALAGVSLAGGVAGAVILLVTPASSFRIVVPYLILGSCALLLAQPRLGRWVADRQKEAAGKKEIPLAGLAAVLLAAAYGSYFGAGLGVVLLALLGIWVREGMQRLNALKGLLSLGINAVSVVVFAVAGHVAWWYTLDLGVTAAIGGTLGVGMAKRLSARTLRTGVVVIGVAVAAVLIVQG
jgi:uncharacterized membrane protein YfcA